MAPQTEHRATTTVKMYGSPECCRSMFMVPCCSAKCLNNFFHSQFVEPFQELFVGRLLQACTRLNVNKKKFLLKQVNAEDVYDMSVYRMCIDFYIYIRNLRFPFHMDRYCCICVFFCESFIDTLHKPLLCPLQSSIKFL